MMRNPVYVFIFLVAVVTFVGCETGTESVSTAEIDKSDYTSYRLYWYDKTLADSGASKAVAESDHYDFKVLPPNMQFDHRFKITNVGSNPLHLLAGPKTCKCTGIKIIDRVIKPGETGEVEVSWKTVEFASEFSHSATIYTNDPDQRAIKLKITGKVAHEMSMVPDRFRFERVMPDYDFVQREILFFSEEWESFEIVDITSTFGDQAEFDLIPVTEADQKQYPIRSGKRLKITLKPGLKAGRFQGKVYLTVKGPSESYEREIDVTGKVITRFSLESVSPGLLSSKGRVNFGRIERQIGRSELFFLTINDEKQREVALKKITANPDYLKVSLEPLNQNVSKHGVYKLKIEIPPGLEPALYNRESSLGELKIEFDHPRVEPINLRLEFYII